MTIVVAVRSRDALIVGSDSVSHLQQAGTSSVTVFRNAQKVFQFGSAPIAVSTWGLGVVGGRTPLDLVAEAAEQAGDAPTVHAAAKSLHDLVRPLYEAEYPPPAPPPPVPPGNAPPAPPAPPAPRPAVGYYVGGFDVAGACFREYEIPLPSGKSQELHIGLPTGYTWRGITAPLNRLLNGWDPRMKKPLENELAKPLKNGLAGKDVSGWLRTFKTAVPLHGMPAAEAAEFARFMLEVTIGHARFEPGEDFCGGPIQLAAISRETGFRWLSEPTMWS